MPKILSPEQIARFEREGCVFPIRVMSEADAVRLRARLEEFEARTGGPLRGDLRHKAHLLFTWLADLVRHDIILDAIEDLYGSDLLCWSSNFFIKEARDPAFVSWHQDSTYWGLDKPDVVTAWVAFTEATEANGAMEYIPESHTLDQIPHRDTFAKHNLLTRGQEVMVEVNSAARRVITLRPGEMSLHHVRLVHGSPPNASDDRRIGFAIRYVPTYVAQIAGDDSASLVRGEDRYGHFELEPRPLRDLDPDFLALHKRITERSARILYRGTAVKDYNDPAAQPERQ
ncbi:MAG TPA: phytanoyl-CoA dioxygenase family protein [Stellaceae bacterium]|nr:phytanoyl-CoA dioxygenase family protein [Stellaceae bacterium]